MKKTMVLLLILTLLLAIGCAAKEESMEAPMMEESADYAASEAAEPEGFGSDEVKYGGLQTDRKVIQSAYIEMETLTFDETVKTIKDMTYEYKGYFETLQVEGKRPDRPDNEQRRDAHFVIRIPKDKYEFFLNTFEKLGNVLNNELKSDDVTDAYIDTEAHIKTLKIQEERLLALLEQANKMEDIIALEERLSQVRYEIEGYTGNLKKWDNLVEFTTVEVYVREVQEVTEPAPETTISRAVDSFIESTEAVVDILKGFVVFLFGFAPFLVIFVPLGYLVRFFWKKRKPRHPFKHKKHMQPPVYQQPPQQQQQTQAPTKKDK